MKLLGMRRIASHGVYPLSESVIPGHRPWSRRRVKPARYSTGCTGNIRAVTSADGNISLHAFRSLAWWPALPVHLRAFHRLPAMETWFTNHPANHISIGPKLQAYAQMPLPYELMIEVSPTRRQDLQDFQAWLGSQPDEEDGRHLRRLISSLLESVEGDRSQFLQFEAPLSLIIRAQQYNSSRDDPSRRIQQLYIAQHDIRNLPTPLGEDLPTPQLVLRAGRGDLYKSSIWLGLQPTYTPLHRDPNPNMFCQLVGSKAVRLVPPKAGLSIYQWVHKDLGAMGNSRLRGPEMMEGAERDALHRAVWVDDGIMGDVWQAVLEPGDALFIPQGWWHSVVSVGHDAELNASANWWFR